MARRKTPVTNGSTNGHARWSNNGGMDVITLNQRYQRIENTGAYIAREELRRNQPDPRRNINDECGYPEEIQPELYRAMYDRDPIGKRVVQVMPLESWQTAPTVFEDENPDTETEFEKAFNNLGTMLRAEKGYYKTSQGNSIWEYLRRADIVSGIGHYGILLLGIDDGKELKEPVDGMPLDGEPARPSDDIAVSGGNGAIYNAEGVLTEVKTKRRLLYLRPYDGTMAPVAKFETNRHNPRYGMPISYHVTTVDPSLSAAGAIGAPTATYEVHWTRCIHLTDGLDTSDYFAPPRQMPVFNRLMDLQKLYGGSAEMYWKGAFPGIYYSTHPSLGGDVEIDIESMKDEEEEFWNGLQRSKYLRGMDAKMLAPTVEDPSPQIDKIIEAICIVLGIPKRIFMGSERGELSSGQDDSKWNDRLRDRQIMYLSPRVIQPFIDRLINLGVLPVPAQGYEIVWPDLDVMSAKEKADVGKIETEALSMYAEGRLSELIQPMDYLTGVMRKTDDEASSWIDNSMDELESEEPGLLEPLKVEPEVTPPGEPASDEPIDDGEDTADYEIIENEFCPTGKGGGIDPKCGSGGGTAKSKSEIAKSAHKMVGRDIQRYSEEHNEKSLAKALGGKSLPDGEPNDIETKNGLFELKTITNNSNGKLTMDTYSQVRKAVKESGTGKSFHTVVFDDSKVFNAKGAGKHDESKRVIYYRRGVAGSARINSMHQVKDMSELKKLTTMDEAKLPKGAQRTDGKLRTGQWKPTKHEGVNAFKNSKTKQIVKAKK